VLALYFNEKAMRLWEYSSHEEIVSVLRCHDQHRGDRSISFFWRLFSYRSLYRLTDLYIAQLVENATQRRAEIEIVCRNGTHVPCKTYWYSKYHYEDRSLRYVLVCLRPMWRHE
jgi:hypothetical protein